MKKIIFALPVALALCACDKKPEQQFKLKCGDFRVSADLYQDKVDLKIVRIDKKQTDSKYEHHWLHQKLPMIYDVVDVTLPKLPENSDNHEYSWRNINTHIFDNDQQQVQLVIGYNGNQESAWVLLGSYIHGDHPEINGHIVNSWQDCTPMLEFMYPTRGNDGTARISFDERKQIRNCMADIEKFGICGTVDENGTNFYWAYCQDEDVSHRIKITQEDMEQILNKSAAEIKASGFKISNIYMYALSHDGSIKTWQTDACEVAQRITDYINQHQSTQQQGI